MPEGLTVTELCRSIESSLIDAFPDEVWVRGAISGLTRSGNGHVYFDLVDPADLGHTADATLPVALFATAKHRVNAILRKTRSVRMRDGVEIQIRGAVRYYPRQGRVQLIMSLIDPSFTLGQIELARAELIEKLRSEGVLDANRRLRLAALPLRVALITSGGSAAEADFVNELRTSGYRFEITLFDTRVQGDDAARGLSQSITEAGSRLDAFDVVAVVRGGGARTDLVAFDHASVARAIAESRLPVVVGIGHEIDRSVADEVAHHATKTPTACAGFLIEQVAGFDRRIESSADRILVAVQRHLASAEAALDARRAQLGRAAIDAIGVQEGRLHRAEANVAGAARSALTRASHRIDTAEIRVNALDPAVALARGWSITHDAAGGLVRHPSDVEPGDDLITTVAGGVIHSTTRHSATADDHPDHDQGLT